MARIPDTELDRLKQEIPIAALVEARGVTLRAQGADLVGSCPFHQDDTPSLHLSVEKNLWHCFGACAQGGSVLDWVMKAEGISFRHAVELLRTTGAARPAASEIVQRCPVRLSGAGFSDGLLDDFPSNLSLPPHRVLISFPA